MPEAFTPPNGTLGSTNVCMLTHTVPASICGIRRRALDKSLVQVLAGKAERAVVHQFDQFLFVVERKHHHRAEGFLVQQRVVPAGGHDQRRLHVVAGAVHGTRAVYHLVALQGSVEKAEDLVQVRLVRQRAELGMFIQEANR